MAQHTTGDGLATTFQSEPRHRFHALSMVLTVILGGVAFFGSFSFLAEGAAGEGVALLIAGPLLAWAGIYAMVATGFGQVEWGLTPGQRLGIWPGIYIGATYAVGVIVMWFVLKAVLGSFNLR